MILHGDCLEQMRLMPDHSIDCVVTDPPYGIKFMGKKWDYDIPCVDIWKEALRVLKPGGHCLCFGGTRTYHRLVSAIEDAGFEIRDQIQWIYGSGFPKSLDISKAIDKQAGAEHERPVIGKNPAYRPNEYDWVGGAGGKTPMRPEHKTGPSTDAAKKWQGFGTALKPANEPICLARKPLEHKLTVAANVLKHGVGGINIDACRIGTTSATKPVWVKEDGLLNSNAKPVGDTQKHATSATEECIAIKDAAPTSSEKASLEQDVTFKPDISCSHGQNPVAQNISQTECKDLSTELYGRNTTEQSHGATSSTTSMATGPITESTILKSCHEKIIHNSIQDKAISNAQPKPSEKSVNTASPGGQLGRWPSNVIFDEKAAQLLDEQSGQLKSGALNPGHKRGQGKHTKDGGYVGGGLIEKLYGNDTGGASRFFYVAKASKSERNRGLDCIEIINISIGSWESADQKAQLQVDTAQSPPKVIAASGTLVKSVTEWNTLLFGNSTSDPSLANFKSTTKTVKTSTIESKTLSWLAHFNTSANILDANLLEISGGNHADLAGSLSPSINIINVPTGSATSASPAQSNDLLQIKSGGVLKSTHPTVKPIKLMEYLIKLICPPGGVVLDPFAGSGSTLVAAKRLGFQFIGIEMNEEYVEIANKRIEAV
jgi:hypothetical protein